MFFKLRAVVQLFRPKHWIKNALVFAPLMFTGQFMDATALTRSILAFVYFSLAASMVYAMNDLADVERDRMHPVKKRLRPIASGALSKTEAIAVATLLLLFSLTSVFFSQKFFFALAGYVALNVAYSFYLKHQPVLDIFAVASGFVLRAFAGAVAIDVKLSSWMFITTLALALYLASIKRLQELRLQGSEARAVLKKYSVKVVERYAEVSAVGAILFYSLYCLSEHPNLIATIPFVLFGIFRYWYIVDEERQGESPVDALYGDLQLIAVVLIWAGFVVYEFFPKS